jgi:hypothetical protein
MAIAHTPQAGSRSQQRPYRSPPMGC